MSLPEPMYYECHVTVDPLEGSRKHVFQVICEDNTFKPAKLLMQKTLEESNLDAFCTAKNKDFNKLKQHMEKLLKHLTEYDFVVRRYKIEAILLDSKGSST